ncbi:ribosome biogenesis regulatory protein homolog isoform X1 [Mytilus californianus]|uniref:ribosome biogenesis regulatory protein homolog isoform X1 n=1 Tax=Mytilus californianus TaxID=6549 RepID=UPI002247EC41|nr:ribosome biogenesis regulatory protein homolog isoform X1 [Mytilus californianus]
MADLVEKVLREAAEKESKFKTIEVEKEIDVIIDEGNLLVCDTNPIDFKLQKKNREDYLKDLSRDNTQILINRIWQLPTHREDEVVVAELPDVKTPIPREKPVPKKRKATKWEEYARMKGINKKKKGRMVYDEQSKEYKPRWGYKRANDDTKDWLIEVPQNADPFEDQFEKRKKKKQERTSKNELQRLRNIARSQKTKVPGVGLTPTIAPSKDHLGKALAIAKKSTASIGKFTESLPKEKPSKFTGKKRKFEPNYGDVKKENTKQLDILNNVLNKTPILDITQAVNTHVKDEDRTRSKRQKTDKKGGKGSKGNKNNSKAKRGKRNKR